MNNNTMRLRIFAHHISAIMSACKDDIFICMYGDNHAKIRVKNGEYYVNGEWVGNKHGAVDMYTKLVANSVDQITLDKE